MKLTVENYHSLEANYKYMSASQYKAFSECQARALAMVKGEWVFEPTPSMLVGSYVDAYFSGSLDQFRAANPQIFRRDGNLRAEFVQAEDIIDRIESDIMMVQYLTGDWQTIHTGEIGGVLFKTKLDVYRPGERIVDLKIMRDFNRLWSDSEQRYVSWVQAWGYDIQAAIYREITGGELPVYLAAATKQNPPDLDIVHMTADILDQKIDEIQHYAPVYQVIKIGLHWPERCGKCDYCRSTKKLTEPTELADLII